MDKRYCLQISAAKSGVSSKTNCRVVTLLKEWIEVPDSTVVFLMCFVDETCNSYPSKRLLFVISSRLSFSTLK